MRMEIKTALRDSNEAARPYVLVNPMLAKHLPVTPGTALEVFYQLGERVAAICKDERVLVIGFAETATAVGAAVASAIAGAVYVHTTRETRNLDSLVTEFLEEHSHARNQALYLKHDFGQLDSYERIVFVEDEISTGKTILNLLHNIDFSRKITVAALVFNGFDESVFSQYEASFICLQKTGFLKHYNFDGLPDPRVGVISADYNSKCHALVAQLIDDIGEADLRGKDILVLGTEEFMYPALLLGHELEKTAKSVKTHSTTRSPLLARDDKEYPINSKSSFASIYDSARTTYFYNMKKYDTVIIITDAPCYDYSEFIAAIRNYGNQSILFVKVSHAG